LLNMSDRRVVITGLGAVSPVGIGKDSFWESLTSGKSGIDYISKFDTTDFDVKIGAEVKNFDPTLYMDKKEAKRMDLFTQYAVAGTHLALEDAKVSPQELEPNRVGVIIGSGIGGISTFETEKKNS
jgi:3-oxoacyl-[acyl-carrier-protein] synthase II (EC 2.3.1.41)